MATAKATKEAAPVAAPAAPATPSTDLTKANSWIATTDEGLPTDDRTGTEDIGVDEIRLPRLAVAQGLSPQIASENPVDGLKLYDMFNDLTNEIFGRGPLYFVPCRRDVRYIEFTPREEGGGVVDLDVPANDPRTQWTTEIVEGHKVRHPPAATKFVEFVILLLREGKAPEPIVLSIKDTNKWNRAAHTTLTSFIKLRNDAIYGGIYRVTSRPEKNDSGIFGVYGIENAGRAALPIRELAKQFHESLAGKQIVVDRGTADEDGDAAAGEDAGGVPF